MKNKKNSIFYIAMIILAIVITIIAYPKVYNNFNNANKITESYQIKKENTELLKSISEKVVSSEGLDLTSITNSEIQYNVYNNDNKIIFHYYLINDDDYNATITLSKNYEILEEKYGNKLDDFEDYKNFEQKNIKLLSVTLSMAIAIIVDFSVILFIVLLISLKYLIIYFKNKKTNSQN